MNNMYQIKKYFLINKITSQKLDYLEKILGQSVNLSDYREKLNKRKIQN